MSYFFRDLAQQILLSASFVETLTDLLSVEIERQIQQAAGGTQLYIPKSNSIDDKEARNRLIREQFDGANLEIIARQYHLSLRQVRRIVRRSDLPRGPRK